MSTIIDHPMKQTRHTKPLIYLISTFLVVNVLFFVDEGFYDFRWMGQVGNWVAFVIYFAVLFLAQFGLDRLLSALRVPNGVALSIILGCSIGLVVLVFGVFG